jgi:hypothetical protein
LFADLLMRLLCRAQCSCPALPLGLAQLRRSLKALLGLLRQRGNGAADFQQLRFGVAHQLHEDAALSTALAPKAAHHPLEVLLEHAGLGLQRRGVRGTLL